MSLGQQHPFMESSSALYRTSFPGMAEYQAYYDYPGHSSGGDYRLDNAASFAHNENVNCGLSLQKLLNRRLQPAGLGSPLETLLDQQYGIRAHQAVDNGPYNCYPYGEDKRQQQLASSYPDLAHLAGLQSSLSALRLANYTQPTTTTHQGHHNTHNFLNFSSALSPSSVNFAQSSALMSGGLSCPPAGSSSGFGAYQSDAAVLPAGQTAASASEQQQHYGQTRLEAELAAESFNSSMFGLCDITRRLEASSVLPNPAGNVSQELATAASSAITAAPAPGGWNPLMSAAAPAVLVCQQSSSSSTSTAQNIPPPNQGISDEGIATSMEEEDLATVNHLIEEYIFYSDDDEDNEESSGSSNDDNQPFASQSSASTSLKLRTDGGVGGMNRSLGRRKRSSLSSSSSKTASLLHQRTSAALDADLRPPSPPPSAIQSADMSSLNSSALETSAGGGSAMTPHMARCLTKTASWSQIVQTVGQGKLTSAQASSLSASATISVCGSSSAAGFVSASPSPPPRGKSISPVPEFHRGPRIDPRWPVSQQVFLGPIPMSITWDEIRNTFYSKVSRNQILHTYVQSKPVNDVVYGQVVFDKTSLANKMLKESPIKVRGHLIHMTSMKDKINLEKRR